MFFHCKKGKEVKILEQIKELLADFDFAAIIEKIIAFVKDFLAKFMGGAADDGE